MHTICDCQVLKNLDNCSMQQIDSLLPFTCCISPVTIVCVFRKCPVSKMLADAFTVLRNDSLNSKVVASF